MPEKKTALLVIDMQNDYLCEEYRKESFPYDTATLVRAVNELACAHAEAGHDVVYIRHIIQNLPTNRLLFGYSLEGTEGAELYDGLEVVSSNCFDKKLGDALSNKNLLRFLRTRDVEKLCLCGLDRYGCVANTALGAVKRGFKAEIVRAATATVLSESKVSGMQRRLDNAGVCFI